MKPVERDEKFLVILRNCFTGGYTFPQYCFDNGIKKPLFVSEEKFVHFIWDVYVQFRYDKRMAMPVQFSFLDLPKNEITFSTHDVIPPLKYKNFSDMDFSEFDAIILLTMKQVTLSDKIISLNNLVSQFINKTYAEIPTLNFLQRHPKVKLFYTGFPRDISRYEGGKEFAETLNDYKKITKKIKASKGKAVSTPIDKFGYTNDEVFQMAMVSRGTITNPDGSTTVADNDHPLMKILNGKRMTADQPEHFKNKIYFVGTCHYVGIFAPYDKTIESYLQKMLNENNLPYRVENEGQRYSLRLQDMFYNLNNLSPSPGDIIFIWFSNFHPESLPFFDASDALDPPHDYRECFFNPTHLNEVGYKLVAERYFKFLTENNFFRNVEFNYHTPPRYITDMVYHRNSRRAA